MNKVKVVDVTQSGLVFSDGSKLYSDHNQDCCEHHELNFEELSLQDFSGLEFDLTKGLFFRKIANYGIELVPISGWSVKVAGHGYNNGCYGSNIDLVLESLDGKKRIFDVSECQNIDE